MVHNTYPAYGEYSINEFLDVVDIGLLAANGVITSLKSDGKIDPTDYVNFLPPLMQIPDALTGIADIPNELKDFTPEELEICKNHVLEKIPEIGDKWKTVLVEAFQIGISTYKIVKALKK